MAMAFSASPSENRPDLLSQAPELPGRTRLHISPFTPSLLPSIIPPSLVPSATNVSFHTLQTFPEAAYGFVELPTADADRIKKKLNGSILKGAKMRVSNARPEHTASNQGDDPVPSPSHRSKPALDNRSRKRPAEEGVARGLELPDSRRVKRGWTQLPTAAAPRSARSPADKRSRAKISSFSTKAECLFRTTLPANVASSNSPTLVAETSARVGDRKVKDRRGRETVIHEFTSTTKYSSFLRGDNTARGGKVVSEYIDGTGWVDDEGNVVEAIDGTRRQREAKTIKPEAATSQTSESMSSDASDSNSEETNDSSPDSDEEVSATPDQSSVDGDKVASPEESSSASESPSSDRSKSVTQETLRAKRKLGKLQVPKGSKNTPSLKDPSSAGSMPSLSITIPTQDSTPATASTANEDKVHPLEAIFKRPANPVAVPRISLEPEDSFSFFGNDETEGVPLPQTPMPQTPFTPFTQRDYRERGRRSPAPTPDTAAPGKQFSFEWRQGDDEDDELPDDYEVQLQQFKSGEHAEEASKTTPSKSFDELFWENRGEATRAWKKRRRETGKERKKRENKRSVARLSS